MSRFLRCFFVVASQMKVILGRQAALVGRRIAAEMMFLTWVLNFLDCRFLNLVAFRFQVVRNLAVAARSRSCRVHLVAVLFDSSHLNRFVVGWKLQLVIEKFCDLNEFLL